MIRFPLRKFLPLLLFVLSTLSVLRLLRISIKSSSSSSSLQRLSPMTLKPTAKSAQQLKNSTSMVTKKEFKLLSDVITNITPCNILIFGFTPQYLNLSSINARGITVILEDEPARVTTTPNNTRIYNVRYDGMEVKKAYKLLRHARENPWCGPIMDHSCELGMKEILPEEIYRIKWDVIVVDGPRGDELEAPGRMGTIYTAAVLARGGSKTTDVFVHDVNRSVEKWFSWEFLCQHNLVSTKGNLWRFRINPHSNTSSFC